MHFNKLKIRGFKGFADPVELPIRPGLSGVVGPNGCGKSNLVEAIGWLMGENRPTVMRGQMDDVIFTGAATRPASSFAEVELEIDNSDGGLVSELAKSSRIDVTRRVERDGVSVFRLNGKEVRRRDVQLLFADSSSGARSSALVRQGQISEIINSRPSARSGILEDAAGIGGLFQRRHEAELKLNSTGQNLGRVNDVIEQLKSRIESVRRQARQAQRYRKIGEQLRKAEAALHYLQWKDADRELLDAERKFRERTEETARLQRQASVADRHRTDLDSRLPPLRQDSSAANAAVQRLRSEFEITGEKQRVAERNLQELHSQVRQLVEDMQRERALEAESIERIGKLEEEQSLLAEGADDFDVRFAGAGNRLSVASETLEMLEEELDAANQRLAEILSRHDQAKRARERAEGAVASWNKRLAKAQSAVQEGEVNLANATIHAKTAESALAQAEHAADLAESSLSDSETERHAVQEGLETARERLSAAEGRLAALNAERAELSRLLTAGSAEKGQILDSVSVEKGYEAAFGAALGDDLFAPALNGSADTGWRLLDPYGSESSLPEGVEPLSGFASAPEQLGRRLGQTGLVADERLDEIQPMLLPGQRIVTRGGDLARWDGFRVEGSKTPTSASLRLKQRNRLDDVNLALAEAEEETKAARTEFGQLETLNAQLAKQHEQARATRRVAEQALASANRELSVAEADASIAERTLESLVQASDRVSEESKTARQAEMDAEAALAELEDAEAARSDVARARTLVQDARNEMLEARSCKHELEKEHEARSKRLGELPVEIADWRARRKAAGDRIGGLEERELRSKEDLAKAAPLPEELRLRKDDLAAEIEIAENRRRAADSRLEETELEMRKADAAAREAGRNASQSLEARGRAEADHENAKARLDETLDRIKSESGHLPAELAEKFELDVEDLPTLEDQDATVRRLRRSRDALGAVNLRAEQDIAELEAELSEIVNEKCDLEEAVADLRETIKTLNKDGRQRLEAAFEKVNSNFENVFQTLFGGGRARLELVEGDDPLDTGLDILCRPPGKRFSNISLLSGGEQTLTALALIFAFFLANPAPICVLDEVDAPLDDSNVEKFCSMLEEINRSTGTRFLIVTHHSITMARMDRLFGVTMQEKGVSQLVSVDLGEAVKMAA